MPSTWLSERAGDARIEPTWWRSFGDPVLEELVQRALKNNVDAAIAVERVNEARGQFALARAQELPNVVGSVTGGRQRDVDAFGRPREQTAGQGLLSASYDLDLFGRVANVTSASRASLLATEAAKDGIRLTIAASTASAYLTLRSLDARLAVLQDTLRARKASLDLVRRRTEAGYASQLELNQADAEFRATEQLIPPLRLAIRRQEDGISLLLGTIPGQIERGEQLSKLRVPSIDQGLPADLLRRRPDIFQAEQQLVAADHTLDSVRAAFLPRISLVASGGRVESSLLPVGINIYSLAGGLVAPILDFGRLQAQQDVTASRRNQAAFAYRKTALAAFRDVEDALASVARSTEQEAAIAHQRETLQRTLASAAQRYRAGYATFLDQLDAERGLLGAELALVQAQADKFVAIVSLYLALGGGWAVEVDEVARTK